MNKAISNESGTSIDFYSPKDKYGKGSLAAVFTSDALKVETIKLTDIAAIFNEKEVDFIKIDVEGFASLAFYGGEKFLRSSIAPDILFEFVDWAESQMSDSYVGW